MTPRFGAPSRSSSPADNRLSTLPIRSRRIRLGMKLRVLVALAMVLGAAQTARADIVEWEDAQGIRHFTNQKEDVPTTEPAKIIVAERGVKADTVPPVVAPVPPEAVEAPRQAQAVYDYSLVNDAYVRGLEEGLAIARGDGGGGAGVMINGPLAVSSSRSGGYGWDYPPYTPLVTTSFDRGRSRHLTLRMLLEDQFQIDRDGPFFVERLPISQGPFLRPFLPRGMTNSVPPGTRVLF